MTNTNRYELVAPGWKFAGQNKSIAAVEPQLVMRFLAVCLYYVSVRYASILLTILADITALASHLIHIGSLFQWIEIPNNLKQRTSMKEATYCNGLTYWKD